MQEQNQTTSIPIPMPSMTAQSEYIVRGIYRSMLGREPESAGLQYWIDAMTQCGDPGIVLSAIVQSDEFKKNSVQRTVLDDVKKNLASEVQALLLTQPITIVDVGAQELDGEQHVYAPVSAYGLPYQVIGFEPLEDKLNESKQKNRDQRIKLFPTFIGDGEAHTFHINNYDATSSLLPLNRDLTQDLVDLSHLATVKTEQVKTSTLDEVLVDVPRIDFLKLDIQGFELAALQHAKQILMRTNVIHCEISFAEIYQGQALFSDVETFLREHGFYFLDFSSSCHYPYHTASKNESRDRLGWGDAVFFKRTELLNSERDLLAQISIAMLVYEKASLAEFLTQAYGKTSGAPLASIFSVSSV